VTYGKEEEYKKGLFLVYIGSSYRMDDYTRPVCESYDNTCNKRDKPTTCDADKGKTFSFNPGLFVLQKFI
jgi:hypothetical protein